MQTGHRKVTVKIDPEFKALIPPLSVGERQQLETNIIAEGCRDPLVLWDGFILDGHNRNEICTEHGIEFKTKTIKLENRTAALLWIIDNQFGRRNLSDIDRIALARRREEILRPAAKANLKTSTGGKTPRPLAKLPKAAIDTRKASAKAAGVGERTYDAGKLILDAAEKGEIEPEVVEKVRRGEAAIHRVAKDIKENRQRKGRQEKRLEAVVTKVPVWDKRIMVGDFRKLADKIPDGSISLIFTDPPYDRKASKMLPDLASFAEAKLADGGSLICYVGQTQIPAAMDALRTKLRYWWTIACLHSGKKTVMREYGINAGWKAVLWFVKGTRDNNNVMVSDVMSGGQEKTHHDWQQSQVEAQYWIENLCPPDGIVCDPFIGGGTTAAAAQLLGRKWIGIEVDKETAAIASRRLST